MLTPPPAVGTVITAVTALLAIVTASHGQTGPMDQDRNGSLAQEEVPRRVRAKWHDVLKLADGNGDGSINRNEFLRQYPRLARRFKEGVDRVGQVTPETIGRLDADGDGVVRWDELPDELRQQVLQLFSLADQNADGGLDKDEIEAGLATLRRMMAEDLPVQRQENTNQPNLTETEMIERAMRLDVSGDGQVGRDEARGPLARQFQQIDSNGNGSLDRREISRAAKRLMERRRKEN
jgi:Ca2+-binding EF-hand superfamily protein